MNNYVMMIEDILKNGLEIKKDYHRIYGYDVTIGDLKTVAKLQPVYDANEYLLQEQKEVIINEFRS